MTRIRMSEKMDNNIVFFSAMSSEEFDKYICEKYPVMFGERRMPVTQTCMCWGFEIGKGWYRILAELCEKLDVIYQETGIAVVFTQVKEKYGTARFYYDVNTLKENIKNIDKWYDMISMLVDEAESQSAYYCDVCGKYIESDELRTICICGWYYGTCKKCLVKAMPEYQKEINRIKKHKECEEEIISALYYADKEDLKGMVELAKKITEKSKGKNGKD